VFDGIASVAGMLRRELLPPHIDRGPLTALLDEAYERIEAREALAEIARDVSERSGLDIGAGDLDGWFGSVSPGEAAASLLTPPAHELRKLALSRAELIEVARRWLPESELYDEDNEAWWEALFDANVPHPAGHLLAYHDIDDATPERVVDLALAYRPIEL
jgi:hypothetical protein